MTKEEAIKFLQQIYPNGGHCWLDEQRMEAISMAVNALQEEPVSGLDNGDMPIERWKQAVEAASNQRSYRSSKGFTETRDDYFVDGVQWADEHPKEEPVSKDLIDVAKQYVKEHVIGIDKFTFSIATDMFISGAQWQKQQDQSTIELAEDHAMLAGMEKMKEEMMAKAIDGEILEVEDNDCAICSHTHLELCIEPDTLEKNGLKDNDKVKVIVIKED